MKFVLILFIFSTSILAEELNCVSSQETKLKLNFNQDNLLTAYVDKPSEVSVFLHHCEQEDDKSYRCYNYNYHRFFSYEFKIEQQSVVMKDLERQAPLEVFSCD